MVCYQIMQAHLSLHQHGGRHHPVPVKPEAKADAGESSAHKGARVRNTHTHVRSDSHTHTARCRLEHLAFNELILVTVRGKQEDKIKYFALK